MPVSRLLSRPGRVAAALVGGGLVAFALPACQPLPHAALVVGDGSRVNVSQSSIRAGKDSFTVLSHDRSATTGSNITLFRLNHGATLARVAADLRDEFSQTPATAAKGTTELVRDITATGLADVTGGTVEAVTATLTPGTYYLMDLAKFTGVGSPAFTPLVVTAGERPAALRGNFSVLATGADRFIAPNIWPHTGSYTFTNTAADTLHFMILNRVKPGTTDTQVQAYFDSHVQTPPPFGLPGPTGGNDVVSPGHTIQVAYNLPRGTYVALCFIADPTTGIPHAFMGMHKVVKLV